MKNIANIEKDIHSFEKIGFKVTVITTNHNEATILRNEMFRIENNDLKPIPKKLGYDDILFLFGIPLQINDFVGLQYTVERI